MLCEYVEQQVFVAPISLAQLPFHAVSLDGTLEVAFRYAHHYLRLGFPTCRIALPDGINHAYGIYRHGMSCPSHEEGVHLHDE